MAKYKELMKYFLYCILHIAESQFPMSIYLFKVNNQNTRVIYEICSELTRKTPERHQRECSGVFIINFKQISHTFLMFLLLN